MSDKKRMDESPKKRVELHLHTKYSQGDSVVGVAEAIKRAREWGMNALAITDHAVVQAFPHTQYALRDYPDFKVIYGIEGYFVNDLEPIVMNWNSMQRISVSIRFPMRKPVRGVRDWKRSPGSCSV